MHALLKGEGESAARLHANGIGHPDLFDRVQAVAFEEPTPVYNWVDTAGLAEGFIMLRWQGLSPKGEPSVTA